MNKQKARRIFAMNFYTRNSGQINSTTKIQLNFVWRKKNKTKLLPFSTVLWNHNTKHRKKGGNYMRMPQKLCKFSSKLVFRNSTEVSRCLQYDNKKNHTHLLRCAWQWDWDCNFCKYRTKCARCTESEIFSLTVYISSVYCWMNVCMWWSKHVNVLSIGTIVHLVWLGSKSRAKAFFIRFYVSFFILSFRFALSFVFVFPFHHHATI